MSGVRASDDKASASRSPWWTLNVRVASVGLFIWLALTLLGSWSAGSSVADTSRFLLSAQCVPLFYLVLVAAYGSFMNRCAAQINPEANALMDSEML